MRRRSRAGGKPVKARAYKAATLRRLNAAKGRAPRFIRVSRKTAQARHLERSLWENRRTVRRKPWDCHRNTCFRAAIFVSAA